MAESANERDQAKPRKKLDQDDLRLVHLKREVNDWRGEITRGSKTRASEDPKDYHYGDAFHGDSAYAKDTNRSEAKLPEATEKDLGLMNLCSKVEDSKEFFNGVAENIRSLENCDVTVRDWNLFGNKYMQGRYVEFLMAFFAVGKDTKIDMKRMSGDGFVQAAFFTEVKNKLKSEDLIIAIEEDSVEFAYDDDDDSDSGEDDDLGAGYLQLKYDPSIVLAWIAKIQNRHVEDQLHMMGLMAYNASNKQNLDIIVKKGGQKLKALFINKFENSNIAALVRFTSELAKHVTGHPDCKNHGYDEEFLVATLDTLKFWLPNKAGSSLSEKNRQQSTKFEVTESRETVMNLIQVIYNLGETMKIFPVETIVRKAKDRLEKKKYKRSPKDDIVRFLKLQEETTPVNFFRHILNQI